MNYLSIDTEYTSSYSIDKKKSGELLQVGIVPVINGVPDLDNSFNEFCRPLTNVWNKRAEEVHKIPRAKAETFQDPSELAEKLIDWIAKYDDVFKVMGYNCLGDKRYIERLLIDNRMSNHWFLRVKTEWKDVYSMVKKRKDFIPKKKFTLSDMCSYFGVDIDAHDALSDALATWKVYEAVKQIKTPEEFRQEYIDEKLTEIEKKSKYTDLKYMAIDGEGQVFITKYATQNKDALSVVLEQIWNLFIEEKE